MHTVRHLGDGTVYVMKQIRIASEDALRTALAEAQHTLLLQHAAVVSCRECFVHDASLCIVMEYCEGGDLHSRIAMSRETPFAEEQLLAWFV